MLGRLCAWTLVGASVVFAAGCAATVTESESSTTESRADGLTVIEADELLGKLVVVFRKDSREITYQLRLGPKMEIDQNDPALPSYQIDARVLDGESVGRPFYLQRGGDAFLDSSWTMPKVEGIDPDGRLLDVKLAREAGAALETLTVPASLAQLRLGALEIARSMEHLAEKPAETMPGELPTEPVDGDGTLAPKGSIYSGKQLDGVLGTTRSTARTRSSMATRPITPECASAAGTATSRSSSPPSRADHEPAPRQPDDGEVHDVRLPRRRRHALPLLLRHRLQHRVHRDQHLGPQLQRRHRPADPRDLQRCVAGPQQRRVQRRVDQLQGARLPLRPRRRTRNEPNPARGRVSSLLVSARVVPNAAERSVTR